MVVFVKQVADTGEWRGSSTQFSGERPVASFRLQKDVAGLGTTCLPKSRRVALLNKVVAAEILPRLAQVRRGLGQAIAAQGATTEVDTLELVRLLLDQDEVDVTAFIETLRRRGVTADTLYIGILSDAARHLGEMWLADRCDFVQVTIGLGRLQQVARYLSPSFQAEAASRGTVASILLLPAPGEQHTFGLLILSEYFHRAGWSVAGGPVSKGFDAATMVRQSWFDIAGFSVGSEEQVESLAQVIGQLRRASQNHALAIMVGGPLVLVRPGVVAQVGADLTADDAPGAVRQANEVVKTRVAAS